MSDIGLSVINEISRDLYRLKDKELSRLLASPHLSKWLLERLKRQPVEIDLTKISVESVYFKGIPVIECDQLHGWEYAFVKEKHYDSSD